MGDQKLETRGDDQPQSAYLVVAFPARELPENYVSFVKSKWKRTLRHGNDYFKLTDSDSFFRAYESYLNHLFNRTNCVIRLAVLKDDRDVALGFSAIEGTTLHYVYVQHEQRNRGVARALVPIRVETISHLTKNGMNIWHSKLSHATFDPFT